MISRIVQSKSVLRTLIEATLNLTNRRFSKQASILHKRYIIEGYIAHTAYKNLYFNEKILDLRRFNKAYYCSKTNTTYNPELELNSVQFEKISNDTLESLTEYFDELIEQAAHLEDADVSYGDGVLTVKFGKQAGTYVINRQTPNKQIWLSSPKSGPKRYDFIDGKWIYKRDGTTLHELLNKEIPAILITQVSFERCAYSGMEQYSDKGLPNSTPD